MNTFTIFTSPSNRTRLLASYEEWKALSTAIKARDDALHIRIERQLRNLHGTMGIYLQFNDEEASLIREVAGVV